MAPPNTSTNGQIQKPPAKKEDTVGAFIERMKPEMTKALPTHVNADRMARVALTALRTTKDLGKCTTPSLVACIMQAAQLGLEVNTPLGHAYLIPRKMDRGKQTERLDCTLMIGYQGLLEIAQRSGRVKRVWAFPVYKGDKVTVSYGLRPNIEHTPDFNVDRSPANLTHTYAAATLEGSDEPTFVVVTRKEIEAARLRGASKYTTTPWDTDYEAMALKTAVRRLYKWLPKSIEIARLLSAVGVDESHEAGKTHVFMPEVTDAMHRQGLELTEGEPDSLEGQMSDAPPTADTVTKPASSPGTERSHDPNEQDAPPPDER